MLGNYKLEIWDYGMKLSHNGKEERYMLHHPDKDIGVIDRKVQDMKIKSCLSICRDKGFKVQVKDWRK